MVWLSILVGAAHAVDKTICVETQTNYTDLHPTADFFVSNIDRPLRGVNLELKENFGAGVVTTKRTDTTGSNKGCATFTGLSTTAGQTYRIRLFADQEVDNALVRVHDSGSGIVHIETLAIQKQFLGLVGNLEYTVAPAEPWSILAVTGWALHRTTGGLGSAIDSHFFTPDSGGTLHVPTGCSASGCIDGADVYMTQFRSRKAYMIAFSLGFTFLEAMGARRSMRASMSRTTTAAPPRTLRASSTSLPPS